MSDRTAQLRAATSLIWIPGKLLGGREELEKEKKIQQAKRNECFDRVVAHDCLQVLDGSTELKQSSRGKTFLFADRSTGVVQLADWFGFLAIGIRRSTASKK